MTTLPVHDVVIIEGRYRGPPESANGGYACGIVARRLDGCARVRLHAPPPLDVPLDLAARNHETAILSAAERLIAEGARAEPLADVPPPVDLAVATMATERFRWAAGHPFPGCFVCGSARRHDDGLCIFPGRVPDRDVVAAPWIPHASVCNDDGFVRPEVMWAALDCPSWFGILEFDAEASFGLLGQLTAHVVRRAAAHEPCVSIGWSRGRDGRKQYGGAALYSQDGGLLGSSSAIWIAPRNDAHIP